MDKPSVINSDTVVVRNDKRFMTSPVGDEIVMMSMESGNYIGLNNVGTAIWDRLEKPTSVQDLINYLTENYDISKEECENKTIKYLYDMLKEEMLLIIQ